MAAATAEMQQAEVDIVASIRSGSSTALQTRKKQMAIWRANNERTFIGKRTDRLTSRNEDLQIGRPILLMEYCSYRQLELYADFMRMCVTISA